MILSKFCYYHSFLNFSGYTPELQLWITRLPQTNDATRIGYVLLHVLPPLGFRKSCVAEVALIHSEDFYSITLRLLCVTVLVLGALLSSFLEEALYKCSI